MTANGDQVAHALRALSIDVQGMQSYIEALERQRDLLMECNDRQAATIEAYQHGAGEVWEEE